MNSRSTALFLFLVAALAACTSDPAPAPVAARDAFVELDGSKIYYKDIGKGDTAAVFIHGWACDHTSWRFQEDALEGRRAIFIDLPGHGRSDKPETSYSVELFALAVDAVVKDAKVKKVILVAHSNGAAAARMFLGLYTESVVALVVVDGAMKQLFSREEGEEMLRRFQGEDYKEQIQKTMEQALGDRMDAKVRQSLLDTTVNTPQHVIVNSLEESLLPHAQMVDPVVVPLLVVNAKSPLWNDAYETHVRQLNPKVDYQVWDDVSHFLMVDDPSRFNQTLREFLNKNNLFN